MPELTTLDDLLAGLVEDQARLDQAIADLGLLELPAFPLDLATRVTGILPIANLGTTQSPTFADVFATGSFAIGNNKMFGYEDAALANGASITLNNRRALLVVSNVTNNIVELVLVNANGAAVSVAQNGLACNLNSDAGATLAVFVTGGTWVVKNRYGVARSVRVLQLGN